MTSAVANLKITLKFTFTMQLKLINTTQLCFLHNFIPEGIYVFMEVSQHINKHLSNHLTFSC